ncbi:MAG: hypothetical protein HUJ89_02580 [Bacteroidales bacterium]|nr:hypothetical protein [Bacteroidales bacterium]
MKRLVLFFLLLILSAGLDAQRMNFTVSNSISAFERPVPPRKEHLRDFPEKTLRVVSMGDNTMTDLFFVNAVKKGWFISPFEICSPKEFETLKRDSSCYFLTRIIQLHSKSGKPVMECMALLKGSISCKEGIENMPVIMTLPMLPMDDSEGRIFPYLHSYVSIFQYHIQSIIDRTFYAYLGMNRYSAIPKEFESYRILMAREDLPADMTQETLTKIMGTNAVLCGTDEIAKALNERAENTLVSLVVAPTEPERKTFAYKMLISAKTGELAFYAKHRLPSKKGSGFRLEDLNRIGPSFR